MNSTSVSFRPHDTAWNEYIEKHAKTSEIHYKINSREYTLILRFAHYSANDNNVIAYEIITDQQLRQTSD